jgi:iron complex transport system ATP-binding protein
LGPNGAGKTTLLRSIVGILKGTGAIKVLGRDTSSYTQKDLAKSVAYVPQPDGRSYPFQVWEFVLMSKYPYLNPFSQFSSRYEREVDEALESVHMRSFKTRYMNTLSSGERQKIMICASLVQNAGILLLDEPTTFLDPRHEEEIQIILKRFNKDKGITVLSVTHNINSAVLLSDRIVSLKEGRVVYFGDAKRFTEAKVLSSVYEKEFKLIAHPEKQDVAIILPEPVD